MEIKTSVFQMRSPFSTPTVNYYLAHNLSELFVCIKPFLRTILLRINILMTKKPTFFNFELGISKFSKNVST